MVSGGTAFSVFGTERNSRQSKSPLGAGRRTRTGSTEALGGGFSDARSTGALHAKSISKMMAKPSPRARTLLWLRRNNATRLSTSFRRLVTRLARAAAPGVDLPGAAARLRRVLAGLIRA